MLSALKELARNCMTLCSTCDSVKGTNLDCEQCRLYMKETANKIIYSSYSLQSKIIILATGASIIFLGRTYKPMLYNEIQNPLCTECSICLEKFNQTDIVFHTNCNHTFHSECLRGWTSNNSSCPNCRSNIEAPD